MCMPYEGHFAFMACFGVWMNHNTFPFCAYLIFWQRSFSVVGFLNCISWNFKYADFKGDIYLSILSSFISGLLVLPLVFDIAVLPVLLLVQVWVSVFYWDPSPILHPPNADVRVSFAAVLLFFPFSPEDMHFSMYGAIAIHLIFILRVEAAAVERLGGAALAL